MRANQKEQSLDFEVLSRDQRESIYRAALEVMERTGGLFESEEALELFENSEAVVEGNRVWIPTSLVEEAIRSSPSKVTLSDREGKRVMHLGRNRVYFGTGSDQPYTYDRETGEPRECTYEDVYNAARVVDALPHIDFFMSHGLVSDVEHNRTYDRHQFEAMVTGTRKPLVVTAVDRRGLNDLYDMALLIRGSEEEFRVNPPFAVYIEPISPLTHGQEAVEKLLFCAEKNIPVIYTPCPSSGATAPATIAGMVVQALAESLQGLVLAYLKSPGTPFVMGGVQTVMDMKTTTYSYGAPELSLASAASTEVSRYLDLPMFSTAGTTDAKMIDEQAAIEMVLSVQYAFLSGASLVHDIGYIDSGKNASLEALVLGNEIIGMVKHMGRGINVSPEHLAPEVIHRVGPGGEFVTSRHTKRMFRDEFYFPRLLDRSKYEAWNMEGQKILNDHIEEELETILENHHTEPLPEDVRQGMREIIERADRKAKEEKED